MRIQSGRFVRELLSAALALGVCTIAVGQGQAVGSWAAGSGEHSFAGSPSGELPARGYERCKNVVIRNQDGSVYTRTNGLFVLKTSCRVGRAVAHKYLVNDGAKGGKTLGFKCDGGSDGVACEKGPKRVTWGYYFDREAPGRDRRCGGFGIDGIRVDVTVLRGSVSCRGAQSVLHKLFAGKGHRHSGPSAAESYTTIGKWRCGFGTGGGACIRHGDTYKDARDWILGQTRQGG